MLGAEYELMRDAGVLRRFYISSLLIVIIMGLTWISVEYAIDLLFHTIVIEMTLAIFFCLLFVCIYIFILNTFSKDNRSNERVFNVSNIIRIGFIAFMGFLIAQPLVILLYASSLLPAVEEYKWNVQKLHVAKIDDLGKKEMEKLIAEKHYYMEQKDISATLMYNNQIDKIDNTIKRIQDNAASYKHSSQLAIDNNSFFLYRIQEVNRGYPMAWLFTFFIILLFLLPGYLVYSISSRNEYYQLKKAQEKKLVMEAYDFFTAHYRMLFNEKVSVFSRYEDPPFNTVRNQPPARASMTDFLQKYLDNS
ncbi:MAG: hypothetical protein ABUL46_05960 [Chitinophaga rupis]